MGKNDNLAFGLVGLVAVSVWLVYFGGSQFIQDFMRGLRNGYNQSTSNYTRTGYRY